MTDRQETVVHDPGGMGFRIDKLWAYVAVHGDGDEGIVGAQIGWQWLPLIGADRARMESLRRYAEQTAAETGKQIRLVRFDIRTVEETIGGTDG